MKNPFDHLRIDTRNMLQSSWYNYPVLSSFNQETIYSDGTDFIIINTGVQDDVWVASVNYNLHPFASGYSPGRKWGQFQSKNDARLYILGCLLSEEDRVIGNARKTVIKHIDAIRQLSIF